MDSVDQFNLITEFSNYVQSNDARTLEKLNSYKDRFRLLPDHSANVERIVSLIDTMIKTFGDWDPYGLSRVIPARLMNQVAEEMHKHAIVCFEPPEADMEVFGFVDSENKYYNTMFVGIRKDTDVNAIGIHAGLEALFGRNLRWHRVMNTVMPLSTLNIEKKYYKGNKSVTFVSHVDGSRYRCSVDKVNVKSMNEFVTKWFKGVTVEA